MESEPKDSHLFLPKIYDPQIIPFDSIYNKIQQIDRLCFPVTFPKRLNLHREWLTNRRNTVVLLNYGYDIVGFSVARPVVDIWPDKIKENNSCNVSLTAITPDFQNRGLVWLMLNLMRDELKRRGFKYWERNLATKNGWSDSFVRHEKNNIIELGTIRTTEFGPQQYIKSLL